MPFVLMTIEYDSFLKTVIETSIPMTDAKKKQKQPEATATNPNDKPTAEDPEQTSANIRDRT